MKRMKKGLSMVLALSMFVMLFVPMMVSGVEALGDGNIIRLTDRVNLGTIGNIESIEKEKLTLHIPMENTQAGDVSVDWTFEIYDENERLVDSFGYSTTVASGTVEETVEFDTPDLCGVYTLKAFSKATYGSEVEHVSYDRENFSVSYINTVGNENIGINVHTIGSGHGTTEEIADAVIAAGYGWIREANLQNMTKDASTGEWTMDQAQVDDLAYYHNKGIKILLQIWGPTWQWDTTSHRGCIPQTDEELAVFRKWMEELVEKTAPYVDAYEVFNECDTSMFPSDFEGTAADRAAKYVDALRVVYEVVDGAKPVVAGVTANQLQNAVDFAKGLWSNGAYNYMDIFSTHRYPYTGTEYIRYLLKDVGAELEKNTLASYTQESFDGMWLTEIGYATPDIYADGINTGLSGEKGYTWYNNYFDRLGYEDGVPRREQARGLTNVYLVNTVTEQAFDKIFVLDIVDAEDPTYFNECWGLLNYHTEGKGGYTPLSAKPAFVATAAFNHFIEDSAVVKGLAKGSLDRDEEYWHAAWFDNTDSDDVIVVQADIPSSATMESDKYVKLSTGASEVDVYDLYGNFLGTMKNSSGQYWMPLTHEAYYLVGEFKELSGTPSNFITSSPIKVTNRYRTNLTPGGTTSFKVTGTESTDTIEVRGLDVESISNGTVTVKVPELFSGKAYGQVLVKDSSGNLKYATVVELWLKAASLQVKTYDDVLGIKGYTSAGVGEISVAITDEEAVEYLALDQISAKNSGIFDFDLNVPQIGSKKAKLRLHNPSSVVVLVQDLIPELEAHYTCVDGEGNPISLSSLTLDKIEEGEEITITLNLGDNADSNIMLMGGVYGKNGALMQVGASNAEGTERSITLTANNKDDIKSIKIFVWDNDYRPIKRNTKIN